MEPHARTIGRETLSRIWEALKKAQHQNAARGAERRRSPRLTLDVPLFVYGHTAAQEPFYEETKMV